MIKKRRKPDFLLVLAVIVALGVVITMKAQPVMSKQTQSASINATPVMMQSALK